MWRKGLAGWAESARRSVAFARPAGPYLLPSLRYLFTTEVHAYAFSIAANAYLSFFPFTLILLTVCKRGLHWDAAYQVILQLLHANLPQGADSVIQTLKVLAVGRRRLQLVSVVMLLFTSSGIFLPLEVALNKVWGFAHNRSFLRNQALAFLLAVVVGLLALFSILFTAATQWMVISLLDWAPSQGLRAVVSRGILEVLSIPLVISIFFVIYYFLPNGKVPASCVLPAAVMAGFLTEGGKFVYFLTLPLFRFREVYGPFALSVTLVFWAFVGSLILLFGAHLSVQRFWDGRPGAAASGGFTGTGRMPAQK